jgi:hypothetical protein
MRAPLSGRGALLGDFGIGMAAALGGKPRRARIDALGRNRWPSAGASLDLDFVNRQAYVQGIGVCTPADVITFSGGAGGTRVNGVGQIVAASGLRYDHDPVTMACKGLLIEEQRTNLLPQSEAVDNAQWGKGAGVSVVPNAAVAPNGTLAADKVVYDGSGAANGIRLTNNTGTVPGAGTSTATSVWLRSDAPITLRILDNYSGGATVCAVTTDWQRFALAGTQVGAGALVFLLYSAAGDNSPLSFYQWGGQCEAGSFATSYIPTTSAAVTRTADNAQMSGASFSQWFNANAGTVAVEADCIEIGAATSTVTMGLVQDSNNRMLAGRRIGGAGTTDVSLYVITGGADQGLLTSVAAVTAASQAFKQAFAFAANDLASAVNAGSVSTDLIATLPNPSSLMIGTAGGVIGNGHIKRIRYWPRRVSNAELRVLTA